MPKSEGWFGDRYVVFGGVIPTTVLVSIGVLGWTFEALVCKIDQDRHRENVRTAVTRVKAKGLLQASRPHGPGFNTRVLTISDDFPAKAELAAVLRAYVKAWPDTERVVHAAMHSLAPRGIAHLKRRGLWPYEPS